MTLYRLKTNKDRTRSTVPKDAGTVNRSTIHADNARRRGRFRGTGNNPIGNAYRNEKKDSEDRILRAPPRGRIRSRADWRSAAEYARKSAQFSRFLRSCWPGTAAARCLRSDACRLPVLRPSCRGCWRARRVRGDHDSSRSLGGGRIAVPVTLSENIVAQWAARYTFLYGRGSTRFAHGVATASFAMGTNWRRLAALERRLTPWFGSMREPDRSDGNGWAEAFSEGSFTSWERTGFDRRPGCLIAPCACKLPLFPRGRRRKRAGAIRTIITSGTPFVIRSFVPYAGKTH